MTADSFITTGDRVVVTGNANLGSSDDLSLFQGEHGIVDSEDGAGLCFVILDCGDTIMAWNIADLTRETPEEETR